MTVIEKLILPGDYKPGEHTDADSRRCEFDIKNEQIFYGGERPDIVFAGDSITHFMEENRLFNKYGFVVNRGIGGDQAHIMAWRFTADVTQLRPRLCIMLVGVNNMWVMEDHIDPATGDYEESEKLRVMKEIEDAFRKMLDEAKENNFDMWICSELPQASNIGNANLRNLYIARVNEMLKALAAEYKTKYIDYHSALVKEDGVTMRDNISREGIHPNHISYKLMYEVIKPELDEYFGIKE